VIVNVTDNDTVTGQVLVTHSGGSPNVSESGGSDSYTVQLSLEPSGPVAVAVVDSAQQLLVDKTALFFTTANWNVAQTVTVTALDDPTVEGTHVIGLRHVATGGGHDGTPAKTIAVSISDNDVAGVIIPASDAGRLTFTPIDDAWIGEADPKKNHGNASRIEVDQSPVKEGLLRFNVSGIPGRAVLNAVLRLQVRDGSPGGGRFFGAAHNAWQEENVTWNLAPAVSVPFLGQLGSVSPGQAVELDASSLVTGDGLVTVRILATSSNRVEYASKEDQAGALAPELIVDLAPTPAPAVSEGGASDSYTIRLASQPVGNVTIVMLPDADLTTTPTQLIFASANWSQLQLVTVSAVDDDETEGAHTARIAHTAIWPGATNVSVPDVTVTIEDNDVPSLIVTETGNDTAVVEGGVGDSILVALGAKPSGSVTVQFSSGGELAATPSTLIFTTVNWQTPQTIQVMAIDDTQVEGDHGGSFTLSVSGGGFSGGVLATVFATIVDNDFVELIPLRQGLELIGWFGLPTTTRAILDSNPRIVRIWVWKVSTQSWLIDSDELPDGLRAVIVIERGQGLFIVSSRATTLEVTVGG